MAIHRVLSLNGHAVLLPVQQPSHTGVGHKKLQAYAAGEVFMKDHLFKPILFCAALGASAGAQAAYTVRMHLVDADGVGKSIGQVTISETEYGTLFAPELKDLPPGSLGFHVHQKPNCEPAE